MNPARHTFAVFENGLRSVGSVLLVVAVAGPRLVLLLALLLFELQVHLLLPGLWRQVRAALPLALGQRLGGAFRHFRTVAVGLWLVFVWWGTQGLLESRYLLICFLRSRGVEICVHGSTCESNLLCSVRVLYDSLD